MLGKLPKVAKAILKNPHIKSAVAAVITDAVIKKLTRKRDA